MAKYAWNRLCDEVVDEGGRGAGHHIQFFTGLQTSTPGVSWIVVVVGSTLEYEQCLQNQGLFLVLPEVYEKLPVVVGVWDVRIGKWRFVWRLEGGRIQTHTSKDSGLFLDLVTNGVDDDFVVGGAPTPT
jgi:hypothetical protein